MIIDINLSFGNAQAKLELFGNTNILFGFIDTSAQINFTLTIFNSIGNNMLVFLGGYLFF
jgi:hypothetical protein